MHFAGFFIDIGLVSGIRRRSLGNSVVGQSMSDALMRVRRIRLPIAAAYTDFDVPRLLLLVTVIFLSGIMTESTGLIAVKPGIFVGFL
jgi:hypothetical protein